LIEKVQTTNWTTMPMMTENNNSQKRGTDGTLENIEIDDNEMECASRYDEYKNITNSPYTQRTVHKPINLTSRRTQTDR